MLIHKVEPVNFVENEVYDLTVENTSTYLVGHERLVAHNSGVGFVPKIGVLNGFCRHIPKIDVVRSTRTLPGGAEENTETWLRDSNTWIIQVGDSAKAWAKAIGKLVAGHYPAQRLIVDLSQIRPAGQRLRGYGWISSGDEQLAKAVVGITEILNKAAARLLTAMEIHDIVNWIGTVLSSRRSAELSMLSADHVEWVDFSTAKQDLSSTPQRAQSNNSLVFYSKPSKERLREVFDLMIQSGGSEPGIINGQAALKRGADFAVLNPCSESILGNKSLCNLVEVNLSKFNGQFDRLLEVVRVLSRANYRQTCVNLDDGILQASWSELNQFLHLCGVGITGYVQWEYQDQPSSLRLLRKTARGAADEMARELDLPYSKRVTLVKPSGCRPWYALVTTDQGILSMDELFVDHIEGDWADFRKDFRVVQKEGSQAILKTYDNGLSPLVKISMVYGMSVESTPEHLWKVIGRQVDKNKDRKMVVSDDRWVRADQLQVNDILDVELGIYRSTNTVELSQSRTRSIRSDASSLNPPTHMSADLAWWLGYLWGNGAQSESNKRTRFMSAYKAHIDKVAELSQRLFGVSSDVKSASGNRKAWICDIASTRLWHWLDANGFFKYGDFDGLAPIPLKVRQSSTEAIIAFIAGLFDADGCACQHKNDDFVSLSYSTADAAFAQHFQDVAWAVGLGFGRSHNTGGKNLQKKKSIWLLTLGSAVLPESFGLFRKHSLKMQGLPDNSRFSMKTQRHIIGKITNVEWLEPARTYDIEVDQTHWYYSGAVKSHNSLSKVFGCTEGIHKPLGKYVFNNINFSKHDPLVKTLQDANYYTFENPYDSTGMVVRFPVAWENVEFDQQNGMDVNLESAVKQLERYRILMENYVDHNVSITVSYDPIEVESIVEWLNTYWDQYVSSAFLFRNDPTKTAADLGYPYLPQEVVTKETYDRYVATLLPVSLADSDSFEDLEDECVSGACPIR